MKYLNILMCGLMILFAVVQYNDPDAVFWGAVYLVAALCAGVAAFRLDLLRTRAWQSVLGICLVLAVIGIVFFWPKSPDFWRVAVWWETETAREGMGMMVATLAVAVAAATVIMDAARRHRGRHGENSELNT